MSESPVERFVAHQPIEPILEGRIARGRRIREIGDVQLLFETRYEAHVAAAVGGGAEAVVEAGPDLQRSRHESADDVPIADPPRHHRKNEHGQNCKPRPQLPSLEACRNNPNRDDGRREEQPAGPRQSGNSRHQPGKHRPSPCPLRNRSTRQLPEHQLQQHPQAKRSIGQRQHARRNRLRIHGDDCSGNQGNVR